jgi:hypothetical protein
VTSKSVVSKWGFMPESFFAPAIESDRLKVEQSLATGYTRFELTFYVINEDIDLDDSAFKTNT